MQTRFASLTKLPRLLSPAPSARCAGEHGGRVKPPEAAAPRAESEKAAKKSKTRQQILMWGDRAALPGGALGDVTTPTEFHWFTDQAASRAPWQQISFGPAFGVAVNERQQVAIWGSFVPKTETEDGASGARETMESALRFVPPFYLELPFKVTDAQCSTAEVFLLSADGRVFVLDNLPDVFGRVAQSSSPSSISDELAFSVVTGADGTRSVRCAVRPLRGLADAEEESGKASSWTWALDKLGQWTGWADRVVKMSVGSTHAAFVTRRGKLYCCGENLFGECGVEPRPFDEASLRVHSHRVDFSNADSEWIGNARREPHIVDVSCGLHHTLCLSKDGKVYAFGDDSKIQLGLGDTRSNQQGVSGTTWMERLKGNKISIPRAVSYTYADRHLQHTPVAVLPPTGFPGAKQCAVTAVAAGDDFSLLLFQDTHQPCVVLLSIARAFPRSASAVAAPSSFALSSSRDLPGPSSIFCAEKVACGSAHCLALMASGKLVGWGFNAHGQVGTGGRVKGAISPPKTIAVDPPSQEEQTLPKCSQNEEGAEMEGKLSPPLPRYLPGEDGQPNMEIKNVFCKFNASAVIRAS
ncbi:conserved hypothetical protein [Neospora caninum Liverpool]|uniref:Regulator of chromosome condensation (RCC1) repeat-containing protein n=1 Tax=Neospora caninum (strain Liverpool) TaxID=572307 RepID=F0VMR5_NEOCL|nr:conserved hypothetical protein [Neospora caninum Liverpool]CBZ55011.1 conserved hypothetical protein [Neospora caninum Liverpool]|eukprot:XP_003885039.1 conserved hypothetical protein [Neospora caninum Liverpool]